MQSLQHHPFEPPHLLSIRNRFDSDLSRFALNLSSSKSWELPGVAFLPSPPMSGSPPPPTPPDIARTPNLRRKRSESPVVSSSQQSSFPADARSIFPASIPREQRIEEARERSRYPQPRAESTFSGPSREHPGFLGDERRFFGENRPQIPSFPTTFQPGFGLSLGEGNIGIGATSFLPTGQTLLSQQESPVAGRATRKAKAHVASACVNCKKKHLRCDNARPCKRCVQSGKEVGLSALSKELHADPVTRNLALMSPIRKEGDHH